MAHQEWVCDGFGQLLVPIGCYSAIAFMRMQCFDFALFIELNLLLAAVPGIEPTLKPLTIARH